MDLGTRGLTLWKLTDVDVRGLTPLEKYAREGRQTRGRRSEPRRANRGDGGGRATDTVRTCGEGIGACEAWRV